jgi:hypothetical protein
MPRSYQLNAGVQRELGWNTVIAADWAYRLFENTAIGEQDLNHYSYFVNGVRSPVLPVCTQSQVFVVGQQCGAGPITFWQDEGRAKYKGLLVKVQKRFSNRIQFTASYALQDEKSTSVWDNLHYESGYGSVLPRHDLNFAGIFNMPWGFQLSMNEFFLSRTPFTPTVPNLDLPGTSPSGSSEPLPTIKFNCLNAGCGISDLKKAVAQFNSQYAGTLNANGTKISPVVLPPNFELGEPINSQNLRLTKAFTFAERYHLALFGEVFNVLNLSNLSGYSFSLDAKSAACSLAPNGYSCLATASGTQPQSYAFGQPTLRAAQSFGSSGPRAFQFGTRLSF